MLSFKIPKQENCLEFKAGIHPLVEQNTATYMNA